MERKEKLEIFRKRFNGRQDVYGRRWQTTREDGSLLVGYAPVCDNFWTDGCHLRTKSGRTCSQCDIKKYAPVTDDSVWKHVSGDEAHIYYLVQDDGSVNFAAMDFDCKPGKEFMGHKFEDVKVVSNLLLELKVPHGIARSTTAGFHLYMFFQNPYSAARIRALMFWLFERAGFMEEMRQGKRPIPEMFPKQSFTGGFGPGNGIKPPMIEHRWKEERNGFVDADNKFIAPEHQWAYLDSIPLIDGALIDSILEKQGIEVDEDVPTSTPGSYAHRMMGKSYAGKKGGWQQPLTGSYEKLVEGCAAVRAIFEKARKGSPPGHHEGFACWHLAMHTRDGIEYFKRNMTGWGQTDKDLQQLEHSVNRDYAPWTCKKLQEAGVCVPGKKCFDKRPPLIVVEGRYVHATDVPPDQWPEPSPIRYAFGAGEDFLEKLKGEVDAAAQEKDETKKGSIFQDIARRAQAFDEGQQRELKAHIKSKKAFTAKDLNKIFSSAEEVYTKDIKEKASTRADTIVVGENCYQVIEPYGYGLLKSGKGGASFQRISNCIIEIEENRKYLDDNDVVKNVYIGTIRSANFSSKFEIPVEKWFDKFGFATFFGAIANDYFNIMPADIDHIRQASMGFSHKLGLKKTNILVTQGWYQDTYLMPTVLVDKDGVRPNTEKTIDLAGKHHTSYLEFKILPEDDFKTTLFHMKHELLNAWPRKWTTIMLGHALLPVIAAPLGIRKKPTLFIEGLTGSGKTELLHSFQYFWGCFDSLVNLSSTGKGLMAVAHDFKDALCVFDDYKGLDYTQTSSLSLVIQYSYDPTTSVKLDRTSTLRKPKMARGIIAFTGEHFLTNDAAMVSRCILMESQKQDTRKTRDKYLAVLKNRHQYCGITPYFIHWFLQRDLKVVKESLDALTKKLYENCGYRQNSDRIAHNFAVNHLAYQLWNDFLFDSGLCGVEEKAALNAEHLRYCSELQSTMLDRCSEEQNGAAFMRNLIQMIGSGALVVEGFNDGDDTKNRPVVGYISKAESGIRTLNIFCDVAFNFIMEKVKNTSPIRGTAREFGRQFLEMKYLVEYDPERFQKRVYYKKVRSYVWILDYAEVGLHLEGVDLVKNTKTPPPIEPEDLPIAMPDGMY